MLSKHLSGVPKSVLIYLYLLLFINSNKPFFFSPLEMFCLDGLPFHCKILLDT